MNFARMTRVSPPSRVLDPFDVQIGRTVTAVRRSRSLSLTSLSREIGISYGQLAKYENGTNRIYAATLFGLATALDCNIDDLFAGLPSPPPGMNTPAETRKRFLASANSIERIESVTTRTLVRDLVESLALDADAVRRPVASEVVAKTD